MVLMDLEWPERRADLLAALDCLASAPPELSGDELDPRWPDLTNAVHWLVDDTRWDQRDPRSDIGLILANEAEADAARAAVAAVLAVAGRTGATAGDRVWFGDPSWGMVQELSARAGRLMRSTI
jgi:hypothetical protein